MILSLLLDPRPQFFPLGFLRIGFGGGINVDRLVEQLGELAGGGDLNLGVWGSELQQGDGFVADRYYGEDYQMFGELNQAGVAFVVRLRDEAVINVEEELMAVEPVKVLWAVRSSRPPPAVRVPV